MSRRPASITQADIARALRAVKQVGVGVVEIEGSKIRIVLGAPPLQDASSSLDRELEAFEARHGSKG